MEQEIIKFYKAYLKRSKTLEYFLNDVNTLGGTFPGGHIKTTKKEVIVTDKDWNVIFKMMTKKVWEIYKSNQIKLN